MFRKKCFSLYVIFFWIVTSTTLLSQNIYNISVDSIRVLTGVNGIGCSSISNVVVVWRVSSSNTNNSYPFCQSGAILTLSTSGGSSFVESTGGFSGKLQWFLFDGDYFGVQTTSIPLGLYRDTLKLLSPATISDVFSTSAQVTPTSGIRNPGCPSGTITNSIAGGDDKKTTVDTVKICTALGVKLNSFEVIKKEALVNLSWTTASEVDFDHFSIEHSSSGEDFYSLDKVPGNGSYSNYCYLHTTPIQGLNYYRLKMVDLDGTFTYSQVKVINFTSERSKELAVFPNPFNEGFTISGLNLGEDISIFDITGKTVLQMVDTKEQNIKIDLSDHPTGIYNVLIKGAGDLRTTKILKIQ